MAARAAIMRLIAAKDELEAQIAALISSLPACVRVAARNDLLDDEGFPRADIDVYQVSGLKSSTCQSAVAYLFAVHLPREPELPPC